MAMEINPPRSKDPEQPRDTPPSHLITALVDTTDQLLQHEAAFYQHPIDIAKLANFTQEAYGQKLDVQSAYLEASPHTTGLFIKLTDNSYLEYRLDDAISEAPVAATLRHLAEQNNDTPAYTISEKEMDLSDFVVYVRSLDSITKTNDIDLI